MTRRWSVTAAARTCCGSRPISTTSCSSIQILARLRALEVPAGRITLICIGEHLGIAHFGGLGELSAEQLGRLPATASTVMTPAALEHATDAWAALRAPDPAGLGRSPPRARPSCGSSPRRSTGCCREYPSTRDGLSLTERRILAAVGEGAPTAGAAFVRAAAREARPFLGDTWCFDRMTSLVRGGDAAAATPSRAVDRHTRLRLTDGRPRRCSDGRADHVSLNGVDRWVGGVHLTGRAVPWRWHEGTESIVPG